MKTYKNLPIYLLSASLLFVGGTSISQAQGATSVEARIASLQGRVKTLENHLKALQSFKTVDISYVTAHRFTRPICPIYSGQEELNLPSDNLYQFALCPITVLVP